MTSDDRHQPVEAARRRSGLSVQQLWLRYVALGGTSDAFDIDGYLQGLVLLDSFQQDVLAQTVNEALEDLYRSLQVPLSAPAVDSTVDGSLRAVIQRILAVRPGAPAAEDPPASGEVRPRGAPPGSGPEG